MNSSRCFRINESQKTVLTQEGIDSVTMRLNMIPANRYKEEFGATKPAFYAWLKGGAISSRGRAAILKMLEFEDVDSKRGLESWTIEELVAALKAKGVKDVQITM